MYFALPEVQEMIAHSQLGPLQQQNAMILLNNLHKFFCEHFFHTIATTILTGDSFSKNVWNEATLKTL